MVRVQECADLIPPFSLQDAIQAKIAEWWEAGGATEDDAANDVEEVQQHREESYESGQKAVDSRGNEGGGVEPPSATSAAHQQEAPKRRAKEGSSSSGRSKKPSSGQDKEMMDFRHLMVKGLELKKFKGSAPSEKCVIYMDVTCRTFFCAKQKNASNAKAHRVEDIVEANANGANEKIICIVHKDSQLDLEVSSPKVREGSTLLHGVPRKSKSNQFKRPGHAPKRAPSQSAIGARLSRSHAQQAFYTRKTSHERRGDAAIL